MHNLNRPVIKETHKTNNLNRPVVWVLVIDGNRLYSNQRGSLPCTVANFAKFRGFQLVFGCMVQLQHALASEKHHPGAQFDRTVTVFNGARDCCDQDCTCYHCTADWAAGVHCAIVYSVNKRIRVSRHSIVACGKCYCCVRQILPVLVVAQPSKPLESTLAARCVKPPPRCVARFVHCPRGCSN